MAPERCFVWTLSLLAFLTGWPGISGHNNMEDFTSHHWQRSVNEGFSTKKPMRLLTDEELYQKGKWLSETGSIGQHPIHGHGHHDMEGFTAADDHGHVSMMVQTARNKRTIEDEQFSYLPDNSQMLAKDSFHNQKLRRSLVREKLKAEEAAKEKALEDEILSPEERHDEEILNGELNSEEFDLLTGELTSMETTREPKAKGMVMRLKTTSDKVVVIVVGLIVVVAIIVSALCICCCKNKESTSIDPESNLLQPRAQPQKQSDRTKKRKKSHRSGSKFSTISEGYDRRITSSKDKKYPKSKARSRPATKYEPNTTDSDSPSE